MNTFQLWEGLSAESLGKLAQFQWDLYHLKLDLITTPPIMPSPYTEVEGETEISKLMKQKPDRPRKVK